MMLKWIGYIFAVITVAVVALIILILACLPSSEFGPRPDDELIAMLPPKITATAVLDKYSDEWDAYCTVIAYRLSDDTSSAVLRDGIEFFDQGTRFDYQTEYCEIVRYQPWAETPMPDYEIASTRAPPFNPSDFFKALSCYKIDNELINLAYRAAKQPGSYFTFSPEVRTVKVLIPEHKLLMSTHYD